MEFAPNVVKMLSHSREQRPHLVSRHDGRERSFLVLSSTVCKLSILQQLPFVFWITFALHLELGCTALGA
jgi:hypothetical protein